MGKKAPFSQSLSLQILTDILCDILTDILTECSQISMAMTEKGREEKKIIFSTDTPYLALTLGTILWGCGWL